MNKVVWIVLAMALPPTVLLAADANPDAAFYKSAAQGGIAEVELGKLAQEKSSSPSVKEFGAMMVSDHSAANEKLEGIAAGKGIDLPTSPGAGEMATKAKLEVLKGTSFDESYIKGMIKDHEEDIKEFQKEAASGRDPDAKAFAKATLPTLQAHLKKIQSIAASAGVSAD